MAVLNIRESINMSPMFLNRLHAKEASIFSLIDRINDWIEVHSHIFNLYKELKNVTIELEKEFKLINNNQFNSDFDKLNLDKLNQLLNENVFQYKLSYFEELISEVIKPMKDELSQCQDQLKNFQKDFKHTNGLYEQSINNFTGLKKITMDVSAATKLVKETQTLYSLRISNCQKLLNRVTVINYLSEFIENWWGKQINRYIQFTHQSVIKTSHDWDNRGYQSSLVQWELNNQMISININPEQNALTKNFQSVKFYQVQDLFRTDLAKFCKNLGLPLIDQNSQTLQLLNANQVHEIEEKEGYLFYCKSSEDDHWERGYFKSTVDRNFIEISDKKKKGELINFQLGSTTINEIDHLTRHNVLQLSHIGVNSVDTILIQPETSGDKKEWLKVLLKGEGDMASSVSDLQSVKDLSIDLNPVNSALFGMDFGRNGLMGMNGQEFDGDREFNHMGGGGSAQLSRSPSTLSQQLTPSRRSQSSWSGSDQTVVKTGPVFFQEYKNQSKEAGGWKKMVFTLLRSGILLQHDEASKSLVTTYDLNKLSRHAIQSLDEGWFGIRGAFSIQLDDHRKLLFQAQTLLERNIWVCLIKTFGHPEIFGKLTPIPKIYRLCRSFWLRIIDGRNFPPAMSHLYCQVLVNGALVAVTPTRAKHENPFWREDFMLDDLPALKDGITVSILSQNKYQKDTVVGNCSVPVQSNRSAEIYEGWYPVIRTQVKSVKKTKGAPLISSIQSPTYVGDLRMRLRYDEAVVLASNQYQPLLQLLLDLRSGLVYDIIAGARDVDWIADTFLKIYCANHMTIAWLKNLADVEVAQSEDPNLLFRGNSVMTKSIETYMKMVGLQYVDETLGDIVRTICNERVIVEVDASKLEKAEDVKAQWKTLISYAQKIWDSVNSSKTRCPKELRLFFSYLREITSNKFKDQPEKVMNTRYTCISGFLFLRLVCPAILSPKLFGLVREHPDPKNQRTLTLLAKSLQCLANLADFGVKEQYMTQMNEFIEHNTNHLMDFIDYIASDPVNDSNITIPEVEQAYPLPPHRTGFSGPLPPYTIDLDRELSSLSRYVVRHSKYYKSIISGQPQTKPQNGEDSVPVEIPTRKSKPEALEKLLSACNQIDFFTKDCIKAGTEEIIWEM